MVLDCLVFAYELALPPDALAALFYEHGLVPARLTSPAWATIAGLGSSGATALLTSAFLHAGWAHLAGNMWTLVIFGRAVESWIGPARFAALYAVATVAAGAAQIIASPLSTVPMVGASGAISGVLGAYFLCLSWGRIVIAIPVLFVPFFFEVPAIAYLVLWLATQMVGALGETMAGGLGGGIAWYAHLGGFLAGTLLGPPLFVSATSRRRSSEVHRWTRRHDDRSGSPAST